MILKLQPMASTLVKMRRSFFAVLSQVNFAVLSQTNAEAKCWPWIAVA